MSKKPDHDDAQPMDATPADDEMDTYEPSMSQDHEPTNNEPPDAESSVPTDFDVTDDAEIGIGGTLGETLIDERDDVLNVVSELENQLDRYEELRERLEQELNRTREQRSAGESMIQRLEWQIKAYQTQVEAHERLRQEASVLEERLTDSDSRLQRVGKQLEESDKENQRLTRELSTAQAQADSLWTVQQEAERLRGELEAAHTKRAEIEQAATELTEERNTTRVQLHDSQTKCEELGGLNQQLEAKLRVARDNNDELRRAQDLLTGKLDHVRNERKNALSQVAHYERENARLLERQRYHEREIASLRNKIRGAEAEVAAATKAFAEVRTALLQTSARTRRRSLQPGTRSISVKVRGMDEEMPVSAAAEEESTATRRTNGAKAKVETVAD